MIDVNPLQQPVIRELLRLASKKWQVVITEPTPKELNKVLGSQLNTLIGVPTLQAANLRGITVVPTDVYSEILTSPTIMLNRRNEEGVGYIHVITTGDEVIKFLKESVHG